MDPIEELKVAGVDMEDEKVINGAIAVSYTHLYEKFCVIITC